MEGCDFLITQGNFHIRSEVRVVSVRPLIFICMKRIISREELENALVGSLSLTDVMKNLNLPENGKSRTRIKSLAGNVGLDLSPLSSIKRNVLRTKYPTVTKTCPRCEKTFTTKSGHPKEKTCCSCACANKFYAAPISDERRVHIRDGVIKFNELNGTRQLIQMKRCVKCGEEFHTRLSTRRFCSISCSRTNAGVTEVTRQKLRRIQLDRISNGVHTGWKSRAGKAPSYPEKFFMTVLANNQIPYTRDLPVGRWFVDFAIEHKKIALEIDGKQHEWPERKLKDVEKDAYLTENGWRVHRIKWKSINSKNGKLYIKNEIDRFLEIYRSLYRK